MSEHDWVQVPEGSGLTGGKPFRFCARCDREEWEDGTVRPGRGECAKPAEPRTFTFLVAIEVPDDWVDDDGFPAEGHRGQDILTDERCRVVSMEYYA